MKRLLCESVALLMVLAVVGGPAQAAERSIANRLNRETVAALARYRAASHQVDVLAEQRVALEQVFRPVRIGLVAGRE